LNPWLLAFGQLHPLILHLPIGLLIGAVLLELLPKSASLRAGKLALLALTAASALLAAGTGWVLGAEEEPSEILDLHRNLGLAFAGASVVLLLLFLWRPWPYRCGLGACAILMLPLGHAGATITHGPDFLQLPWQADSPESRPATSPTSTYELVIAPIFERRCTECHGEQKQKGGLQLHQPETIHKGGKSGSPIVAGKADESRLVQRLGLPLEHKKHMPPRTKEQPTPAEIGLLKSWIAAGAPFTGLVAGLEAPANLPAPVRRAPTPAPRLDLDALASLRKELVHVQQVANDERLLWIDFAAIAAHVEDPLAIRLLTPLKAHVAELGLARSKVTDAVLPLVAGMPNLRRLDLRGTAVTPQGLAALEDHADLEELVVAETRLGDAAVQTLLSLPALRRLVVWNAGLSPAALEQLRARDDLAVEAGDKPDAVALESEDTLKLTSDAPLPGVPPAAAAALKPSNDKCPITGKPVDPRYVIVDLGRAVGFCCPNCPKEFWQNPEACRAKLK
jgi:uncharacterized membrane protein